MVFQSASCHIDERLWAKLPSYYNGDRFIRIIPFKDQINIKTAAIKEYRAELNGFKIAPKGMLQAYLHQNLPAGILLEAFKQALLS